MKWAAALATSGVLGVVLLVGGDQAEDVGKVDVVVLTPENFDKFAPQGKEVDAIAGDLVLRNKYITAVIAQPTESRHANMTVREVGGALIDFSTRIGSSDQLSAFYPGQRQHPYRQWRAATPEQDSVPLTATTELSVDQGRVIVTSPGNTERPEVEVTYILEPDEWFLNIGTRYRNVSDKTLTVNIVDDVRIDAGKENLQKTPNGVAAMFWAHDRHWRQAYVFYGLQVAVEMNSDARTTTLKYRVNEGKHTIDLAPGATYSLARWAFVGESLLDVKGTAMEFHGDDVETIEFTVLGNGKPIADAEVALRQKDMPYGSARTDSEGRVITILPPGTYDIDVSVYGVKLASVKPPRLFLVAGGGGPVKLEIPDYKPGRVVGRVVDGEGQPVPAKIALTAKNGTPQPDFGPETADFAVKNLRYTADGTFEQTLPPGEYDVIVSRGPEHDAVFTSIVVKPGEDTPLEATLRRSVDTKGWISADFHSHSSPSGDNTGSQLGRVLNLLAEHVEFGPCTEHNRIDTYEPHLEKLNAGRFMATCSGIELTGGPLPLNHQNAFPLKHNRFAQNGGGPVTDPDPATQIERLARWDDQAEKLVQVNHPDLGWMFYDRDGDGTPDMGHNGMFAHINALEVHPVEGILHPGPRRMFKTTPIANTVFHWLQLVNQGYRYTAVGNTDAHYNFHGSSWCRNWIQSPTDDPAAIQPLEMVRATKEGRLILSNGPFLEMTCRETGKEVTVTAGQDLAAPSGKIELKVRVQCPNWFDIDRVFVLVNGKVGEHNYTRKTHAAKFRTEGAVKFEETLTLQLDGDSHVIVACGGEETKLGPVMGPDWKDTQPAAFANPVYVDVNGDGFKPNRDTLGHPLPVKFVAKP